MRGKGGVNFTVKAMYDEIMTRRNIYNSDEAVVKRFEGLWKTRAPFKAQVLAWRLLWNRLPTIDNLIKRNVGAQLNPVYSCCKNDLESAKHLLLHCPEVHRLWCRIVNWTGTCWVPPTEVDLHQICLSSLLGVGKIAKRLGGLWICVNWVI